MLYLLRQLLSILALPVVMALVIPWRIAVRNQSHAQFEPTPLFALGVIALAIGLALFSTTVYLFATRGRGTLAPWDPPRELVVAGPYRYVRNPMISGVMFVLLAEAALARSMPHFQWACIFIAINLIYIPLFEEPQLEARFGEAYRNYKRHVRRIIPRLTPWTRA